MKIKNLKFKKYSLVKLYILKYTKTLSSKAFVDLKYLLRLIYEYHVNQKTILFTGLKHFKRLNNKTLKKHILLSKNLLSNGVLSNKKYLKNKISSLLIKKTPDLVLIFNATNTDINFITELLQLNIPVILLGYDTEVNNFKIKNNKNIYLFGPNLNKSQVSFYKFLISSILLKKI